MRKPTMSEIRKRTKEKIPHFFSKDTMLFFHQSMRDFRVIVYNNRVYIVAVSNWGNIVNYTTREFTGDDLIMIPNEAIKKEIIFRYNELLLK